MPQQKPKTNEQRLKALNKELSMYGMGEAIQRERLLAIAEMTKKSIIENPEGWQNPIIPAPSYLAWAEMVIKHLKFDD